MKKLSIKLENCFGIGKFEHDFNFKNSNSVLIYAPNGTMKTSFAKTFDLFAKDDSKNPICDRIYTGRTTNCEILVEGQPIKKESILVVDAEDNAFDATNKISSFIASKELKKQYDDIYSELNTYKNEFLKKLKTSSKSSDCEEELISTFLKSANIFETLLLIADKISDKNKKYDFKYNDIFDKKGNVKKFLDKNQKLLQQYFDDYQKLLLDSNFFNKSENSFGTIQAKEIEKAIEDNAFFNAGHKFILNKDGEIDSASDLTKIIEREINNIVNDAELKANFDKIDKSIGANTELRAFKNAIENNNLLLIELQNYDDFKKDVWFGYLSELKSDVVTLTELYKSKKEELANIISEAKKEIETWENIVTVFNSRFYVPFTVEISNQEDIILKQETANLDFKYKDSESEQHISKTKDSLLQILSKGEKRAYYILQLLFEIESRKLQDDCSLLIFDDIADSFDYKNKYAIIEYIRDLNESGKFQSIILTHNFDFYRTIFSRLNLNRKTSVFMVVKNKKRVIKLYEGQYRNNILLHYKKHSNQPKIFIALIPFVRNIVEYSEGENCCYYTTLTNCLHMKNDSDKVTCNDIQNIFRYKLQNIKDIDFGNKKVIDFIYKEAGNIINEQNINEVLLENKIVLSIAIRLKAEQFMLDSIPNVNTAQITSNQTWELFKMYKNISKNKENIKILDKVNLMTPENIHINAFMYEPLIDMSIHHLKSLYNEVLELKNS